MKVGIKFKQFNLILRYTKIIVELNLSGCTKDKVAQIDGIFKWAKNKGQEIKGRKMKGGKF